jgi:hypothetical protein
MQDETTFFASGSPANVHMIQIFLLDVSEGRSIFMTYDHIASGTTLKKA